MIDSRPPAAEAAARGTVITFGTFDLFHVGHLRLLKRARAYGERLVVGVSTDELNRSKKGVFPVASEEQRMEIVGAVKYVDEVFSEESLDLKREYVQTHGADCLVMGDDWKGSFDWLADVCRVIYLPRTTDISTTELVDRICMEFGGSSERPR